MKEEGDELSLEEENNVARDSHNVEGDLNSETESPRMMNRRKETNNLGSGKSKKMEKVL